MSSRTLACLVLAFPLQSEHSLVYKYRFFYGGELQDYYHCILCELLKTTKRDGMRGLRPFTVFSATKRQSTEGERRIMSPPTPTALSWLFPLKLY